MIKYWNPLKEESIARELAVFFDVDCNYLFYYDDVVELPKRPDREAVGVYPKLTVKGRPANFGPEWFKTFEEARVHILDLAAYIFEESCTSRNSERLRPRIQDPRQRYRSALAGGHPLLSSIRIEHEKKGITRHAVVVVF